MQNLKMAIKQNIIHNFPVKVEDIDIEKNIFGPDVSNLNERTTIKIPKLVVNDFIERPKELLKNNQELTQ